MKGLIIYNTKYGATRQYAEWLGQELDVPVTIAGNLEKKRIDCSDYLLIGTSVYYGKLRINKWLKNIVRDITNKKLFLFIVCATGPDEQAKREKIVTDNVPGEIRNKCEIYFLPGRLIHKDLTFFDKLALKMVESTVKDPRKKKAIQADLDEVKKENLEPIIKGIKRFCSAAKNSSEIHACNYQPAE